MTTESRVMPEPACVLSIGCDLIEIDRIAQAYKNYGTQFLDRIFTPEEQSYALSHKHPEAYLATRFAGKEAVAKALQVGIGKHLGWKSISIQKEPSGAPKVHLSTQATALMQKVGGSEIHITLSHTRTLAQAMVILCGPAIR